MKRAPSRPAPADLGRTVAEEDERVEAPCSEISPDAETRRTILPCLLPSSLRGVVVDTDGVGVAGIVVRADFTYRRGFGDLVRCGHSEVSTDSTGAFVLEPPVEARWADVTVNAPGWVAPELRVASRGAGTTVIRSSRREASGLFLPAGLHDSTTLPADSRSIFRTTDDGRWPEMRIVLERGTPVEGTVETEASVAIPGALVTALWQDDQPGWRCSETRADDRGRFSVLIPAVAFLSAAAIDPGGTLPEFVHDPQAWTGPVPPGTRVRLVMRDFASLELRLRGPSGPIKGAAVTLLPSCGRPSFRGWPEYDEASGTLRLDRLLPGTYEVEVNPDDRDCLPTRAFVSVPGPPIEIRCPTAMCIEGFLEGDDVSGFGIEWTGPGRNYDAHFDFEGDGERTHGGRFYLHAVGDAVGDVYARRTGDPRCAFVSGYSPAQGYLRLSLSEGQTIRGRVEGCSGPGLETLRIRAVAGSLTQEAKVGGDGSFAVVGLPPRAFRVELRSDGWLHDACDDVPAGADGVRLHVRLPATEPEVDGS